MNKWTSPADLRARVLREWERGNLLAAALSEVNLYPWRIALKSPTHAELTDHFEASRQWIKALSEGPWRLEHQLIHHRQLGRNQLPVAVWLDSEADALALIGKQREAAHFAELVASILADYPVLWSWLVKRPLRVLEHGDDWPRLLAVLGWISAHPQCGLYLRQIDLPGVHSKFIERHRALLGEMLDLILPAEAVGTGIPGGVSGFERRYGFRKKPTPIRFRLLDGNLHGLTDLTVPAREFANLVLPVQRVFITENEINFLAFPPVRDSLVIFGAGYGFDSLATADWLKEKEIHYWGDIDTHGFAILDQLRGYFPHVRSLLMDRPTLLAHPSLWGREEIQTQRELQRLHPDEASLYDDLRQNRIAPALRLEQERIGYAWVQAALIEGVAEPVDFASCNR